MAVYYDPGLLCPRVPWSKTVYPQVLRSLELWLGLFSHAALVALLHFGHLEEDRPLVPLGLAAAAFGLSSVATAVVSLSCQRWHEAFVQACCEVGASTRLFVQELQATFGRLETSLPLRFAAAKYALAGVYLFFFAIAAGAPPPRCWGELRAKGLLDDRELQFLERKYGGDRMALLHVWAMWAVHEAAADPAAQSKLGREALASSLLRLSEALLGAATSARRAADLAASPVPYHNFQLQDALLLVCLLIFAAVAASASAATHYVSTVVYVALALSMVGYREATASLLEPLHGSSGFPVAETVNATADAVAQLLIAATPEVFDPSALWGDASRALFSQGQVERRTPVGAFMRKANPCHWEEPAAPGAPPPLLDVGCCHLDVKALPGSARADEALAARRPKPGATAGLLARLQRAVLERKGQMLEAPGGRPSLRSSQEPSEVGSCGARSPSVAAFSKGDHDWEAIAGKLATEQREYSPASSVAGLPAYPGAVPPASRYALGGAWVCPPDERPAVRRCSSASSPNAAGGSAPRTRTGSLTQEALSIAPARRADESPRGASP